MHTDFNCLSVLQYAIDVLQVEDIIVCRHYGCGGVKAAMDNTSLGLVDNWIRNIRNVYRYHRKTLDGILKDLGVSCSGQEQLSSIYRL